MSHDQSAEAPLPPRSSIIHNMALAGAIVTPLAMLLPPRKLDIRFFVLAGTFSIATNHLAYEYTGQLIYSRCGNRLGSMFDSSLPEGARRTQQLLKEQKERHAAEKQRQLAGDKNKTAGLVKDIWMGGETADWQEKRAEEHRKSIQEGKGLSGIIFEQIADVWNGNYGKKDPDAKHYDRPSEKKDRGAYNLSCKVEFKNGEKWIVRFPMVGKVVNADEKIDIDVATMNLLRQRTTIPIPEVKSWGLAADDAFRIGPFIMMDFVEGISVEDILQNSDARNMRQDIIERAIEVVRISKRLGLR
ncbi:hypothetical protein EsHS_00000632 [Epichloe bromicola]